MKIFYMNYNHFTFEWAKYIDTKQLEIVPDPAEADIIYCSTVALLEDALKVKQEHDKELVCWCWDVPLHQKTCGKKMEMLKQCDVVISASKTTQKELIKHDISSEQIYFYHTIKDIIPYQENNSNYFVQISRYAETKRFDISVKAFQGSDLKLRCIGFKGQHPYFEKLNDLAGKNTEFFVNLHHDQKIQLLKNSIGLLAPSVFEGFGLSPMESIACGRPIILSDTPIHREIWEDAVMYHDVDDRIDLKITLEYLAIDKNLQKISVNRCQRIIRPFTPELFAERITKFLINY